ncbi:hypothetical protein AWB80_08159 [Caballeronia pedi]|uniref:Uncharacterized protein n=1 Tax=Caballeronia pedi TaxID=1777141 RepID=A0A158E457_9BURK|nr:hypothetical protein [Caballeronia pedi]SAL01584.1 hypothetical protein AWB80_08159 [Caballeronia pedi]
MKVITTFEARDGATFYTEHHCRKHEAALSGRPHECPKCKGTGTDESKPLYRVIEHKGPMPNSVDGWGAHQCVVREKRHDGYMPCDVCQGHGYTAEPKRPITRTEVVGYE